MGMPSPFPEEAPPCATSPTPPSSCPAGPNPAHPLRHTHSPCFRPIAFGKVDGFPWRKTRERRVDRALVGADGAHWMRMEREARVLGEGRARTPNRCERWAACPPARSLATRPSNPGAHHPRCGRQRRPLYPGAPCGPSAGTHTHTPVKFHAMAEAKRKKTGTAAPYRFSGELRSSSEDERSSCAPAHRRRAPARPARPPTIRTARPLHSPPVQGVDRAGHGVRPAHRAGVGRALRADLRSMGGASLPSLPSLSLSLKNSRFLSSSPVWADAPEASRHRAARAAARFMVEAGRRSPWAGRKKEKRGCEESVKLPELPLTHLGGRETQCAAEQQNT